MKRYNLSEIMTSAHRTYKYVGKKQGKTFGEVLKSTWMLAKISAGIAESEEKSKEVVEEVIPEGMIIVNNNSSFNSLDLTWDSVYVRNSRGYMGSQYCGD